MGRLRAAALLVALLVLAAAPAASRGAAKRADPFALVNGCYALRALSSNQYVVRSGDAYTASTLDLASGVPFHMQATNLAEYMLVGPGMTHPAADQHGRARPWPSLAEAGAPRGRPAAGGPV